MYPNNYSVLTSAKGGQFEAVLYSPPLPRNSIPVVNPYYPILCTEILYSY
jgi:hypothetical protein